MKKTKNLCIRALCAIFIGVALGCSDAGGGSNGEDGDTEPETGWKQPAYYINEELGGQQFVNTTERWYYDDQKVKDQKFTEHYNDADQYINGKVAELQELWQEKRTGSALSNQINTALNGFNQGQSIGQKIRNNYTTLAPVFFTMQDNLIDDVDFYQFKASYHKLAHYAYNNSLGDLKNSENNKILSNVEMTNSPENLFVEELSYANLSYNEFTVDKAKTVMKNSLSTIANRTNTNADVLKKVVELALYNESLYGLNDFVELSEVSSLETSLREYLIFDIAIYDARNKTQAQNIDDRTM